jgi:glycosidase
MPWSEAENGGFTTGAPWLPLNPDWRTRNVAAQTADPGSLLNLYRRLTRLRRDKTALRAGSLHLLETEGEVLGYERRAHPERLVVLLNLGAVPRTAALPRTAGGWRALLSSDGSQGGPLGPDVELAPNQALILEATA